MEASSDISGGGSRAVCDVDYGGGWFVGVIGSCDDGGNRTNLRGRFGFTMGNAKLSALQQCE